MWLQKVQNVTKRALKLLFFAAELQKSPSCWGLRRQAPFHSQYTYNDYAPYVTR